MAKVVWRGGLAFEAELNQHKFMIDAREEVGGGEKGPSPKGLTLISLAGCTGMDVISMLLKMRQPVAAFEVNTEAEVAEEHPRRILSVKLSYIIDGDGVDEEKIKRAVQLSEDVYCGVSATLKPTVAISSEIVLNGEKI